MAPPSVDHMFTLKVDNIPLKCQNEELRSIFSKYGEIGDIYIPRALDSMDSRGFAFIRYITKEDAEKAIEQLDGYEFAGKNFRLQFAKQSRPDNPKEYYRSKGRTWVDRDEIRKRYNQENRRNDYDRNDYDRGRDYGRDHDRNRDRGYERSYNDNRRDRDYGYHNENENRYNRRSLSPNNRGRDYDNSNYRRRSRSRSFGRSRLEQPPRNYDHTSRRDSSPPRQQRSSRSNHRDRSYDRDRPLRNDDNVPSRRNDTFSRDNYSRDDPQQRFNGDRYELPKPREGIPRDTRMNSTSEQESTNQSGSPLNQPPGCSDQHDDVERSRDRSQQRDRSQPRDY